MCPCSWNSWVKLWSFQTPVSDSNGTPDVHKKNSSSFCTLKLYFEFAGFYPNVNDVSEFWARFFQLKPDSTSTAPTANVNSHNPWFAEFWEEMFNCRLDQNGCDVDNQNLNTRMPAHREMDNLVSFTLMAVQAIIRGTRAASQQFCQNDHLCSDILNINRQRGPLLYNSKYSAVWLFHFLTVWDPLIVCSQSGVKYVE